MSWQSYNQSLVRYPQHGFSLDLSLMDIAPGYVELLAPKITKAFADMRTKYQRVRAAVYWHERWENKDGSYSNLRVNSSPAALDAYRSAVADPYWIDRPQFRKRRSP